MAQLPTATTDDVPTAGRHMYTQMSWVKIDFQSIYFVVYHYEDKMKGSKMNVKLFEKDL